MKNRIIALIKQLLKLFYLFPINKKRIVFSAYSGKQYSCNPKYITEYLMAHYPSQCEIIWAFNEPDKFRDLSNCIKKVKFKSLRYIYFVLTANVVVDNVESWSILPKRKGQTVINTWHGGGAYKGVGLKRKDASQQTSDNMLHKNQRISLYLSSSKAFTQMTLRDSFGYQGKVLEKGMPRNDLLLHHSDEFVQTVRKKLNLKPGEKVLLFAPTFRKDKNYQPKMDFEKIVNALKIRFGGEWKVFFRGHYYVQTRNFAKTIDVSDYPDMQELLLVSDVLITDYSSSMWDFSLTKKPCFLFVPDLSAYSEERDFYTPITTWPFPYGETSKEVADHILSYSETCYRDAVRMHHQELGSAETGHASEYAAKIIIRKIGKESEK